MEQYISKSAVVAEINRVLNSYDPNEITSGRYAIADLRNFLDTLEVKEVDFEREMQAFAKLNLEPLTISDSNIGIGITMSQLYDCARRFFELGLKAPEGMYNQK